jgi:uncharacterized membrane protein
MVAPARLRRTLRHLFYPRWQVRRLFPPATLERIASAIRASERQHRAELRLVVEGGMDAIPVWRGYAPRDRAIELFSQLGIWDTAENCGVLLYVQLVDHDIEIVADRGVSAVVSQAEWEAVCERMEKAFRAGRYDEGALEGVAAVTALLARHFPSADGTARNELPDQPLVLCGGS